MTRSRLAGAVLASALFAAPIASAQYTNEPFFQWTVLQSQAIGLELALQRLRIVEAIEPPFDDEFAEVVENLTGPDFQRFGGTLATLDSELAEQLFEVLEGVAEAVEEGEEDEVAELLPAAREMLEQAYDIVVPEAVRTLPAFRAGLMAQLLLGEGGVAEGLEEAFEEEWEFANGWAATQRVREMWLELAPLATENQRFEITATIDAFDAIYPSPEPPETLAGIDPEEAETPAQRMVGFLESVVDASLYSGRDPARLIGHLAEMAADGCARYEAGEDEVGREIMYAVFDHYAGETTGLGDLIGLFAPEVHEEAMEGFEHLVVVEDDDDDDEGGDDAPAGDDEDEEAMEATEACEIVLEAIEEGLEVLGG